MARSIRSRLLASAVVAALPAVAFLTLAPAAQAQYQIQTGHALDANPRIGSGGYNGVATPHYDYNVNNNVVTGNVSGLNYFHGGTSGEFDSNVFQGQTGSSNFDQFNNVSTPVNYARRDTGVPNYQPVYNTGNYVGQPPANFVQTPGGVGYIPAPQVSPLTPTGYDTRQDLNNVDPTRGNLIPQGQLNVAGPVDPSGNSSMFSMSPLYGVRPADNASVFDQTTNTKTTNPADRSKVSPADLQKMRDELNTTVIPNAQSSQGNPTNAVPQPPVSGAVDLTAAKPLNSGAAITPTNLAAADQSTSSGINNSALTNGINSGQGMQNQLVIPPAKQSKQLAELERRFAKDKEKLTDVEASQRLNEERRAQAMASSGGPTAKNGGAAASGTDTSKPPIAGSVPPPKQILDKPDTTATDQPYVITSLATGIDAKGLANLMKSAEDLMRQGKFTEAVDSYDTAEQVAPNNPFVALGRSFAEIGASYYGKADQDLSRAVSSDPAILAGRYDLKGFLGEDRLKFVHDDLQDIADHEKGARPLVILGFIAHNNGDDALAAKDLTEASKRGGYADLVKLMQDAWKLK